MKTGLFFTGAAARITQEVALFDKLVEHYNIEMNPENIMLAGFSSGALNIAGVNACFRKNAPLSWDDYYKNEVLFPTQTADIYTRDKLLPLNTKPLRNKIDSFLSVANTRDFNDFEYHTYILAFSFLRLRTFWANNDNWKHHNIVLSDLLMATSAIPIIFPDQEINRTDSKRRRILRGRFADGGSSGSFKRFEVELGRYINSHGPLDKLFIISPMREVSSKDYETLDQYLPSNTVLNLSIKDFSLLKDFLAMISMNGFDSFVKRFEKWSRSHNIANQIFVSIPKLDDNFPILLFDHQKEQYQAVIDWVDKNPEKLAVPIEEYVKKII
jgi:hypothetical protein